jgi:hypothetical protein
MVHEKPGVAWSLFFLGLYLLFSGMHDFEVGWEARKGPTPTPCDGPIESEYIELRDCHFDFREALPAGHRGELTTIYVPVRSAPGIPTGIVLRLYPGGGLFALGKRVLAAPDPSIIPDDHAVHTKTLRAAPMDSFPRDGYPHDKLVTSNVSGDYQMVEVVEGDPPTPTWSLVKLIGGVLCVLFGLIGAIEFVRKKFEKKKLV